MGGWLYSTLIKNYIDYWVRGSNRGQLKGYRQILSTLVMSTNDGSNPPGRSGVMLTCTGSTFEMLSGLGS